MLKLGKVIVLRGALLLGRVGGAAGLQDVSLQVFKMKKWRLSNLSQLGQKLGGGSKTYLQGKLCNSLMIWDNVGHGTEHGELSKVRQEHS